MFWHHAHALAPRHCNSKCQRHACSTPPISAALALSYRSRCRMLSKDVDSTAKLPRSAAPPSLKSAQLAVTMAGVYSRYTCILLLLVFCGAPPHTEAWKCKGCSGLECKPTGSCTASDGELQPAAAPWFFDNDAIVQHAWAACAPPSCPLIVLP